MKSMPGPGDGHVTGWGYHELGIGRKPRTGVAQWATGRLARDEAGRMVKSQAHEWMWSCKMMALSSTDGQRGMWNMKTKKLSHRGQRLGQIGGRGYAHSMALPESNSWFCKSLAAWPWARCLSFLCLCFLICEMRIMIIMPTSQVRVTWMNAYKALRKVLDTLSIQQMLAPSIY